MKEGTEKAVIREIKASQGESASTPGGVGGKREEEK